MQTRVLCWLKLSLAQNVKASSASCAIRLLNHPHFGCQQRGKMCNSLYCTVWNAHFPHCNGGRDAYFFPSNVLRNRLEMAYCFSRNRQNIRYENIITPVLTSCIDIFKSSKDEHSGLYWFLAMKCGSAWPHILPTPPPPLAFQPPFPSILPPLPPSPV